MNTEEEFLLRWRGGQIGPLPLSIIERKLDDREIGMLHEILHEDQWMTLDAFFVEISRRMKATELLVRPPEVESAPAARALEPAALVEVTPQKRFGARLLCEGVTKSVRSHVSGQQITLLEDITLVIEPNEFVALLGPAGAGKSTLIDALNGRRPATGGSVFINGLDLNARFNELRPLIGCVPQKDIIHPVLTVRQELAFAAQLRLPAGTPAEQIDQRVSAVINKIGLNERQQTRNANLSGGQSKRVNLGVELLADPTLLFLDEATSGQDAGTEARLMTLFRKLASEGKTVVCITHNVENVGLCDLVAVLTAGRLAFYGPPGELPAYFNVEKTSEIYDTLATKTPAEWAERYRSSEQYQQFVAARLGRGQPARSLFIAPVPADALSAIPTALRQFLILTRRYATVTLHDKWNVLLLLAQAPAIGLAIGLVFRKSLDGAGTAGGGQAGNIAFVMALSAIWFGCFNAVKEIVKELPIYLRERAINLSLPAYLGSKVAVLSLLCAFQCATLYVTIASLTHFQPKVAALLGMLLLTALCGMMLGLAVSALVNNSEKAQTIAPILMIPQVIFAGVLSPLSGLAKTIGTWLIVASWSMDGLLHTLPANAPNTAAANFIGEAKAVIPQYTWEQDLMVTSLFLVAFAVAAIVALKLKDKSR